jgi:glycosyltransferase involved in cell wall biosynthesis
MMTDHKITAVVSAIPPRMQNGMYERAMASIQAQTLKAFEISVSFDTDKVGAGATRNRALRPVKSEWIAFLDDDDEWLPCHLQRLAEHQEATEADVVFPWFETSPPGCDPFPQFFGRDYDPEVPHMFPICVLMRTDLARSVGGFRENGQTSEVCAGEDWEFWLKCRDAGAKFAHLPERTWIWHHHGENTSGLPSRWH